MSNLECPKCAECKDYRVNKPDGTEDPNCFNPSDSHIEHCFNPVCGYDVINGQMAKCLK